MAKRRIPDHPGKILNDQYMTPGGISSNRLGEILKVPANRISDIVRSRRGITADTALRLAQHFKTEPEYWMDLQRDYELQSKRAEIGTVVKTIPKQKAVRAAKKPSVAKPAAKPAAKAAAKPAAKSAAAKKPKAGRKSKK